MELEIRMAKRYYLHGDEVDSELATYYCAFCDLFVTQKHFSEISHSATDKDKYDRSVKSWTIIKKESLGRLYRPNNSSNLFSHLPKPKKPKTGSFYRWVAKQKDRDDPIGDLSQDIKRDKQFPLETNSLSILTEYLVRNRACDEAIQALAEAYAEFKAEFKAEVKDEKTIRSGISLSLRFDIFRRDNFRCNICGSTASDGVKLEVDHKVPVAKGGSNELSNLWTLCFKCNRGKGTKDL